MDNYLTVCKHLENSRSYISYWVESKCKREITIKFPFVSQLSLLNEVWQSMLLLIMLIYCQYIRNLRFYCCLLLKCDIWHLKDGCQLLWRLKMEGENVFVVPSIWSSCTVHSWIIFEVTWHKCASHVDDLSRPIPVAQRSMSYMVFKRYFA